MGLGETQVFQDEKSRLANTTVARIVAAKGSLRRLTGLAPGDWTATAVDRVDAGATGQGDWTKKSHYTGA